MAAALWMPAVARIRQSPSLRTNLTEWHNKVHRLWSLRKQHWAGERRVQSSSRPSSCQTSRTTSDWKSKCGFRLDLRTPNSERSATQLPQRYGRGIKAHEEANIRHRHEVEIPPLKSLGPQPDCRPKHSKTSSHPRCRPYKPSGARREVLNAIHDYHLNAEARAQLEKRADNFKHMRNESARSSQLRQVSIR